MLTIFAQALLLATRMQPMPRGDLDRSWTPEERVTGWNSALTSKRN